nr:MAG TPA: hypothetical protein [Caudoviricetes sp.]
MPSISQKKIVWALNPCLLIKYIVSMLTYLLVHIDNRACFRLHGMYPTTTCSSSIKESELYCHVSVYYY